MSRKFWIILIVILIVLTIIIVAKRTNLFKKISAYDKGKSDYKYFLLSEFDSEANFPIDNVKETVVRDGKTFLKFSGRDNMKQSFMKMIDSARNIVETKWNLLNPVNKIKFKINSGYRTPTENEKEGGVENSAHVFGLAADISTAGYTVQQKKEILKALYTAGFRRFGIGANMIHVDNDLTKPENSVWNYGQNDELANYEINDIKNIA